jgi:hypothetical protein
MVVCDQNAHGQSVVDSSAKPTPCGAR